MKFSNGCWLQRENVGCFSPAQVYEYHIGTDEVSICAPTTKINGTGDTLGGVNLTIKISAPYPEVLRIRTFHHMGLKERGPAFELAPMQDGVLQVEDTAEKLIIHSGSLRMEILKENGAFTFYRKTENDESENTAFWVEAGQHEADQNGLEKITSSGRNDLAYMKTNWTGLPYDKGPEDAYMRERLNLSVGELIYGLGERYTPFVKNGQTVDIWNEDGGTSTEQAYKNIPFYISNRGYGVFVNHPEKVSFEVASESVSAVQFSVAGEELDYMLINGPTMKEVLMRYTDITGKPALPAPWTFGLWLSTSFTTDYDEETVTGFVDGMLERDIPLAVFHFDCCWMKDFHWSNLTWDSKVFPDPEGMLRRLKEKGVKICVWINSYIAQESSMFREGVEGGYFLKRPNGDVWQWDMWQPGMAIVDFTNPRARAWYASKLDALMDMGVDCFKTDFGERIPTDVVYYDGSDPEKMHNYYTYIYNKTVFETIQKKKGKKEAFLFARSATAGSQKYPVHWGGDCWSDYESMEQSLRGGLSLTSSGFGFWSHDIGGFESTSTADVYKRWCAFGLLSTHSRLHGSHSYRVPWLYDEEAVDVVRRFTKLKASLMPYLYRNAIETSVTGVPMMRSMVMEYTEDRTCSYLASQYMLGDSLLVAPVFREDGVAEYYLPEGTWTSFLTGEVKEGKQWYKEYQDYMSIPLYVKEGSIIAVGAYDDGPVYDYAEDATFKVYAMKEDSTVETCIYNTSAEKIMELKISQRESGAYRIELNCLEEEQIPCSVELVGIYGEEGDVTLKKQNSAEAYFLRDGDSSVINFTHDGIVDVTINTWVWTEVRR